MNDIIIDKNLNLTDVMNESVEVNNEAKIIYNK